MKKFLAVLCAVLIGATMLSLASCSAEGTPNYSGASESASQIIEASSGVAEASDSGVADTSDSGIAEASDSGVADTSDSGIAEASDSGIAEASDSGVADISDSSVAEASDSGVADTSDSGSSPVMYIVTWKNGDTVLSKDEVEYGATPEYKGEMPTKEADAQYVYAFKGWDKEPSAVVGDVTYTATFGETLREYTVTWKNGDTVLSADKVAYGAIPEYKGDIPTKETDAQYVYTFSGWDKEPSAVVGDVTYTATFSSKARIVEIGWNDDWGNDWDRFTNQNEPAPADPGEPSDPEDPSDPGDPITGDFETDYTVVSFIESSGTQYIDTGFAPDSNTRVVAEIDFVPIEDGNSHNAFSATNGSRANEYGFLTNGKDYISRYGDDIYISFSYPSKPFVIDMDKNELKIDGETIYTHEQKEFSCGCNMYIFTCDKNGSSYRPASMKLYSMKIYNNGVLVRDFIPCYRNSDNKVGLYDKVEGVFYVNSGTGEFSYASIV